MIDILLCNKLLSKNPVKFDYYYRKVYSALASLNWEYPAFQKWYFEKVYGDISKGKRCMLIKEHNKQIVGVSILKKSEEETKICTFRISKSFQRFGFGQEMLIKSMDILESRKPIITVSEKRMVEFSKLLTNNDFTLYKEYEHYYNRRTSEFAFNGPISPLVTEAKSNLPASRILAIRSANPAYKIEVGALELM